MTQPPTGPDGSEELPVDTSLLDPSSGLFAEPFFTATLNRRLAASRRVLRPFAVALFEVVDGLPRGPIVHSNPKVVAAMAENTMRHADVAARLGDGSYGLLLDDTPEDGALWAVERLRRSLDSRPGVRGLRAGIACYPGSSLTAVGLLRAAQQALAAAREWPQDRIEVAPPSP